MKFAVLVFPGSNCDHDCYHALKHVLGISVDFVWHGDRDLTRYDVVILPGGFSYGDYLRAGAIARFSDVMKGLDQHIRKGGYALGICNGFQILTEAGHLPGALIQNRSTKFICEDSYIKAQTGDSFVTSKCGVDDILKIPIAHKEGCFVADEDTLDQLDRENRVVFRYCDQEGNVSELANPNGSARNIAGIISESRRVAGMMPHPERVCEEELGGSHGLTIFQSVMEVFN